MRILSSFAVAAALDLGNKFCRRRISRRANALLNARLGRHLDQVGFVMWVDSDTFFYA